MGSRRSTWWTALVSAVVAVGASGADASAAAPVVTVDPGSGRPGAGFTVTYDFGDGCADGAGVRFLWDGGKPGEHYLGDAGAVDCVATLRTASLTTSSPGAHTVQGLAVDAAGKEVAGSRAEAPYRVLAGEPVPPNMPPATSAPGGPPTSSGVGSAPAGAPETPQPGSTGGSGSGAGGAAGGGGAGGTGSGSDSGSGSGGADDGDGNGDGDAAEDAGGAGADDAGSDAGGGAAAAGIAAVAALAAGGVLVWRRRRRTT